MPEMQPEDNVVPDMESQKETIAPHSKNISQTRSHESLWGALLFASMLLFVIASIVSIVWIGYSQWKSARVANAEPSVTALSEQLNNDTQKNITKSDTKTVDETIQENKQAKQSEEKTGTENTVSAKKLVITVLNGGAIKGSAGTIVTFLKGEGYTSVTAGNTQSDYKGTVIYYATGLDKEVEIVKASLIKKYPQAKTLLADVKNKETSVSQITIILGK